MGWTGPVPNKSTNLSRERDANRGGRPPVTKGQSIDAEPWPADPGWTEPLRRMWESLAQSGQASFYQASDWAYAWFVFDEVNVYRKPAPVMITDPDDPRKKRRIQSVDENGEPEFYENHKPSGQMFQAIMSALSSLGMTEGDRRRMRIELEDKPEKDDAEVLAIAEYQDLLGVAD